MAIPHRGRQPRVELPVGLHLRILPEVSLSPLAPEYYCKEITTPAGVWTPPAVALKDTSPVPNPDGTCSTLI